MASSDILVVGGGIIGACLAFHLARRRAGRVVLLDRAFPGAGASGKAAAIIRSRDTTPQTSNLARNGLHVYEHFGEIVGGPAVFSRTGLALIASAADHDALAAAAASAAGEGEGLRLLSTHELAEIDPNIHVSDGELAAMEPAAGYLDPVQVVASFSDAARRQGVDVRQGVEVKRISVEKGRVTGVETNEGTLNCGSLALAPGAWTANLLRPIKVNLPLETRRSASALFRRPPDAGRRAAPLADFAQKLLFRPTPGELVQVSDFALAEQDTDIDPDNYDEAAPGEWLPTVRQRMSRRYPALHRAFGRGGFSTIYAVTPDGHPIVDRLPGLEGVWCAAGFGGDAFQLAPAVAEALSAHMTAATDVPFDLGLFRVARFEERGLIQPDWPFGAMT
jgi:glycine/D-amino acid oxidase-like deaminating enzyme